SNGTRKRLARFNRLLSHPEELRYPMAYNPRIDFLGVVETVLSDVELIAGPLAEDNTTVQLSAKVYRDLIQRMACFFLPFIAIQIRLHGDVTYKAHVRILLDYLEIGAEELPYVGEMDLWEPL
ncbi:unnamed protein product, partial [marine sediment metagenome]